MYIEQKELFRWRRARKNKQEIAICTKLLVIGHIVLSSISYAVAGITGFQSTGGAVTYQDANRTVVTQSTSRMDAKCTTLSTAVGETFQVDQPSRTAVGIFRVNGGVPSEFAGLLKADGSIFILNKAGITFTGTSQVNVGALIATTAEDVTDDGKRFAFRGSSDNRKVINHGTIQVSPGGFAILAAPYVENTGLIQANLGRIELASTRDFTVDLRGDGLIGFTVTKENVDAIAESIEKLGVDNSGTLLAQSGTIGISANLASSIVQSVVNLGGVVDADAFGAGHNGGTVLVTSVGDLNITGNVHANGGANGNGGTIYTWADGTNSVTSGATLTARGGTDGGNGGQIEVSGAKVIYRGAADASAPKGKAGTLLIDPWDMIIADGEGDDTDDTVYEENIEHTSKIGTNVKLEATNSITMEDLSDDKLEGGSGNITMTAGGGVCTDCSITFDDKGDKITTTSGKITMTAADGAEGLGTIDIGHLQTTKNGGDITLTAGSGGITTGDLSTGGEFLGAATPGVITLTTSNQGDIAVADISIVAEGAGTASASLSASAGGDLTTGSILVKATDTASAAAASAILHAGNDVSLEGPTTVEATGATGARASADIRAGHKLDAKTIAVMAHAHKEGYSSFAPISADAAATLIAGSRILVEGDVTVDAVAENEYGNASANASLLAAAGAESVEVEEGRIELTFGEGAEEDSWPDLTITGDVEVTADATSYGNANATANAVLAAADDVNITTGPETLQVAADATSWWGNATADATLIAAAGLESLTVSENEGVSTVEATFDEGDLTINGDIDVTADATAHYLGDATAAATAILAAGDDVNVTTGGDTVNVAATAETDTYYDGENYSHGGSATAVSNLVALTAVNDITVTLDGVNPTVLLSELSGSGDLNFSGDITVTAEATVGLYGNGDANAAAANLMFADDVDIHTGGDTLGVGARATNYGHGEADAHAGLVVSAGFYDGGDLDIYGDVLVEAQAWEASGEDGGHARATTYLNGVVDRVFVHGDIEVTAKADHSEVNVGFLETAGDDADITLAALNANGTGEGNNGTVTAADLQTTGEDADITVDAGSGGIHTYNLSTGGEDEGEAHPGDIRLTTTNGGDIETGDISIIAQGTDSASAYLNANAAGDLTTGSITVTATDDTSTASAEAYLRAGGDITTDDITVAADADKGVATAGLYADAGGNIDTGPVEVTAQVDEGHGEGGAAYADASASLTAGGDITVEGDVKVKADAESSHGNATANATLLAAAGVDGAEGNTLHFSEGDLTINGDVKVTADATSYKGAADATALAMLVAADDVNITTGDETVKVAAKAATGGYYVGDEFYDDGGYGGSASAVSGLVAAAGLDSIIVDEAEDGNPSVTMTASSGNLNIDGNIKVKADATVGWNGNGDAIAEAGALLAAGNNVDIHTDAGTLKVDADATNYAEEGDATADATLLAAAGVSKLSISELTVSEDDEDSTTSTTVQADFGNGNLTITGDVHVTADATSSSGDANATAAAMLVAGNDVTIDTATLETLKVTADAETMWKNANANATLIAAAGLDSISVTAEEGKSPSVTLTASSGDLDITGSIKVKAEATVGPESSGSGDVNAAAGALLAAGNDVDIETDEDTLKVEATANNYGYGDANAGAALLAAAGIRSLSVSESGTPEDVTYGDGGEGNLTISGNIKVKAEAWENDGEESDGGHAEANANLLAAGGMDNTFVYDDIKVTASADHSEVNVGDLKTVGWGADITLATWNESGGTADNNGVVNAGNLKTIGGETGDDDKADIIVDAGSGGIHTGNLSTGGEGLGVARPGDILLTTSNGGDIQTGNISIIAEGTDSASAYLNANASGNLETGSILVKATDDYSSAHATAYLRAGGDIKTGTITVAADGAEGEAYAKLEARAENDLTIRGDVLVKADAKGYGASADASADLSAGHNATIDTDPVTVAATATSQSGGKTYANAHLNARAGDGGEGDGEATGDLYITGDISATAMASGGDTNTGRATIDLSATGNVTNLYGTTPPTAYAPNPDDPAHARVQAPAHLAGNFSVTDPVDGDEAPFFASVSIQAGEGKTVKVEPKPSAPVCERDECEVVAALKPVEPMEPLFPGRDPLRIMPDGLVVWATGAGVTAPSTGAIVTADVESAIAAGADPTTLLPATAAGGQGLSAGLDAYSIGGLDYCEQVVKGACLPVVEEKGKSR